MFITIREILFLKFVSKKWVQPAPFIAQTGVLARHGPSNIFVILTDVFTLVKIPQVFMFEKRKEYFLKARENSKGLGMLMVSPSFDYFKSLESDCHNIAFKLECKKEKNV